MSAGLALLKTIITGDYPLTIFSDKNINKTDFRGIDEKKAFDFIINHIGSYGKFPKIKTVEKITGIDLGDPPDEPVEFWVKQVLDRNDIRKVVKTFNGLRDSIKDADADAIRKEIRSLATTVNRNSTGNTLTTLSDEYAGVMADHDIRRSSSVMAGIPFGLPYIDNISDGAQKGDTVAIVAKSSVGKTYLLLHMAITANLQGRTVLIVTLEMTSRQVARRCVALGANVSATSLRLGSADFIAEKKIKETHDKNKNNLKNFYIMAGGMRTTIDDITLMAKHVKPDVIYIDGAYLIKTKDGNRSSKWETIADVAECIKMLSLDEKIPSISTYQYNRKKAGNMDNIGGSAAIPQLASIVLSLENDTDETWAAAQYKVLELLKGREGEVGRIKLVYDMIRTRIYQHSVMTEEE